LRVAETKMDDAVMQYLKRKYNLLIASARGNHQDGGRLGLPAR